MNDPRARLRRYSRHLLMPEIALAGQEKIVAARVLCIGVGGLGCAAATYLAAAGAGRIGLIDDDVIDPSNLQRQPLYTDADLGRAKVDVAAERLHAQNPTVTLDVYRTRLTRDNAAALVGAYDVVVDGSDNFSTRYLVNDACVRAGKPNVFASIYRFEAQITVFAAGGRPCYRCLYSEPPPAGARPSCAEGGVLGAVAGLAGSWQAIEALKLITGAGRPATGKLIRVDALNAAPRAYTITADPACPLCGETPALDAADAVFANVYVDGEDAADQNPSLADIPEIAPEALDAALAAGATMLDLREPHEAVLGLIPGAVHIPYSQLDDRLHELDSERTYIVACRAGQKSRRALARLHDAGLRRLCHLRDGLLAYAAHGATLELF